MSAAQSGECSSRLVRRRSSRLIEDFKNNNCGKQNDNCGEISEEMSQGIRDAFDLLDSNKDGKLCKKELETLLRSYGMLISDTEIEELLRPIDIDHNGTLDFEEFEKFLVEKDILNKHPDEVSLEIMEAFNVFDKNGDGYIDFDELKVVLTQMGDKMSDELAKEFIKAADLDGDGRIDYIEFSKHMGF